MRLETPTTEQIRQQWDAISLAFDEHTSPMSTLFGERLVRDAGVRPGTRLLDVGAGSGAVALPAARLGADVVAVDLSPVMIDRLSARASAEGLSVDARVMDGSDLDLPDAYFDRALSLNGVSLFPDLAAGLAEMARVTRPGGQVVVAAFGAPQRVEFLGYFMAALQATVPGFQPLPMDPPPLPFQLAEPAVFRERLGEAGLYDVRADTVTWETSFESATHFWNVVTSSNPIGAMLTADLTADQRSAALEVLDGMLRERSGGEPGAVLDIELNIGTGTA